MSRPLYRDESIWIPVVEGIRRRGWQVHAAGGEGRLGRTDREQLSFALKNDWILFTFDTDFLKLIEGEGLAHAGVVYADQAGARVGDVVKAVDAFLEGIDDDRSGIHYL